MTSNARKIQTHLAMALVLTMAISAIAQQSRSPTFNFKLTPEASPCEYPVGTTIHLEGTITNNDDRRLVVRCVEIVVNCVETGSSTLIEVRRIEVLPGETSVFGCDFIIPCAGDWTANFLYAGHGPGGMWASQRSFKAL